MSAISNIVANLESGNGANNASQPPSMVNPTYGQYGGFVSQYGNGAEGVDNYASQVLAHNPNATLGDFYSGYVLGTGNPGSTPGVGALQSQYPAAYANLITNSGYSADTPLSSLVGTNIATGPVDSGSGGNTSSGGAFEGVPPTAFDPLGSGSASLTAVTPDNPYAAPINLGLQPGLLANLNTWVNGIATSIGNTFKGWAAAAFGSVTNVLLRIMIFLAALVMIAIALFALFERTEAPHA